MVRLPKSFLISTALIALVYLTSSIYLMNFTLVKNTIIGNYDLAYKLKLLLALLEGMWTAMTRIGLFLLIITSILTGVNITLIGIRIMKMQTLKNVHYIAGGGSLLGVIGSGCAACGLPLISVLGLSGSIVYLPFHGVELSYLSILLLSVSLYFMLKAHKNINKGKQCARPLKRPIGRTQFTIKKIVI